MSRLFGWCAAPDGAIPQHAKPDGSGCPGNVGGPDGLWCSCAVCHDFNRDEES